MAVLRYAIVGGVEHVLSNGVSKLEQLTLDAVQMTPSTLPS